jgi:hypothetical protein
MDRLLPQTKKQIEQMIKDGYPVCLMRGDWSGNHRRHCNSCIVTWSKYDSDNRSDTIKEK